MGQNLHDLQIVLTLTVGFTFASLLGFLALRLHLSPILGYLLAGYLIGPYSPGFVAELKTAEQLAEIGVILMMFGVGLGFRWQDLVKTKNIAIPGAIGQTLVASIAGAGLIYALGWSIEAGVIIGLSVGVASTVVMIRVLTDNHLLQTKEGHIAVGWLIVEDIITVAILILIPSLAPAEKAHEQSLYGIVFTISAMVIKFVLLASIMFTVGRKVVAYVLAKIENTKSNELFTLTVLALTFIIATGSALLFGTSIALGAFIAGMVIGQTAVRLKAVRHSAPMKDAFAVIFFLSVGMLFNPSAIVTNFLLFITVLAVILVIKPLAAYMICMLLRHPARTGLIVALALAQIGEFSFILAESGLMLKILPDEGFDIIVACALVSIAINPLLFRLLKLQEHEPA